MVLYGVFPLSPLLLPNQTGFLRRVSTIGGWSKSTSYDLLYPFIRMNIAKPSLLVDVGVLYHYDIVKAKNGDIPLDTEDTP